MATRHLYDMAGVDTIAANSLPQALVIWYQYTSESPDQEFKDSLAQIPDKNAIKIRYEFDMIYDLRHVLPLNATFEFDVYFGSPVLQVIATAKEWAEVTPKPAIICSTEW